MKLHFSRQLPIAGKYTDSKDLLALVVEYITKHITIQSISVTPVDLPEFLNDKREIVTIDCEPKPNMIENGIEVVCNTIEKNLGFTFKGVDITKTNDKSLSEKHPLGKPRQNTKEEYYTGSVVRLYGINTPNSVTAIGNSVKIGNVKAKSVTVVGVDTSDEQALETARNVLKILNLK